MKTKRKPRVGGRGTKSPQKPERNVTLLKAEGAQCFWVHNGPVLSDINELERAIRTGKITDLQWKHHVSKSHNDFSSWIQNVFCNPVLAKKIKSSKTKVAAQKALAAALKI